MPLPKIDQPLFEMTIPSNNKKVMYRPFTVKEEKILLIAQESKDMSQVVTAIKQIITNCLVDVDPDSLAVFDLEYIMLKLRAKAVNNEIEFTIKDPETEEEVDVKLDINDIEIERNESHTDIVNVTDDIVLKMKYPSIEYLMTMGENNPDEAEAMFDLIRQCIDAVVQGDNVYKIKDFTQDEVNDFIDGLTSDIITKVKDFFDTMPQMKYEYKYTNKNGKEQTFVAKGTETFFI
jgi:hypothetical protein